MIQKGMVIKLKEKYAIVASDTSDFVRIKRKDGMIVGQKIYFDESDKVQVRGASVKSTTYRNSFTVLALAASLMLMAILVNPFGQKDVPVYAVVTLDINPSFEMTIDRDYQVLSIRAVNEDSKELVDENLVGKPLDEAIRETVLDVESSGIEISDKSAILISTVIVEENVEEQKTQEVEKEVVEGLDEAFEIAPVLEETKVVFVEANKEDIEAAKQEDLSVGKYKLIEMSDDTDKFNRLDDESIGNLIQNKDIAEELETDKESIVLDGHSVDDIHDFIESHNFEDEPLEEEWLEDFEDDDFYEDEDSDEDVDHDEDEEYDEDDIEDFDEEDFDDETDFEEEDFDEETLEKIEEYIEEEHQEELREIEEMKETLEKEYEEELERIKELEALEEEMYLDELKELEELEGIEAFEKDEEKDLDALIELVESEGIETLEDLEKHLDKINEFPEELIELLIEELKMKEEEVEEVEESEDDFEEEHEESEDDFEEEHEESEDDFEKEHEESEDDFEKEYEESEDDFEKEYEESEDDFEKEYEESEDDFEKEHEESEEDHEKEHEEKEEDEEDHDEDEDDDESYDDE